MMLSMLRSLSLLTIAVSLAVAGGDQDVIHYVTKKLSRNPSVKLNKVTIVDKLPIPGLKGWSAYIIGIDLNLTRRKQSRKVRFDDMLFVSKNLIAPELFDRASGRDVRSMIQPRMPETIYRDDHLLYGNKHAAHRMIIFSDPLCPFCRTAVPQILKAAKEHPDKIALYYYHLPLGSIHPASEVLVRVMELAQKEGKMAIVNQMYTLAIDPRLHDEKKILAIVEKKLGYKVTPKQIHQPWIEERLQNDREMARKLLVSGTPTIFADGKKDVTREAYKRFIQKK